MVAEVVKEPLLNSIIFRYLLAHAEQPQLLKDSQITLLRDFAERDPFYADFVETVFLEVESEKGGEAYDESRLLQIGN